MAIITQIEFENALDDILEYKKTMPSHAKFSIADYLIEKRYAPILQHINFAVDRKTVTMTQLERADHSLSSATMVPRRPDNVLNNWDYSGCEVTNCRFDECDLSGSTWKDQLIHGSSFNNTAMNDNHFEHVTLANNDFSLTAFDYSTFHDVQFSDSNFFRSSFSYLKQCHGIQFIDCTLQQASMLGGAPAVDVTFKQNKFASIELLTDKELTIENGKIIDFKPTILGVWNNAVPLMSATLAEKMLLEKGMHPIRMDMMADVDASVLDDEINQLNALVKTRFSQLKDNVLSKVEKMSSVDSSAMDESTLASMYEAAWKKEGVSFPLLMIQVMREEHEKNPDRFVQMTALYDHAKIFFDKADGVMLTGGQDMDPRFYGEALHANTGLPKYADHPELSDPRRDVIEFSLVYMQQKSSAPKPLCGICRGSQVIAASYGATIYQELDSPERRKYFVEVIQPIVPKETPPLYSTSNTLVSAADKEVLNVMFMHHQGYTLDSAHGVKATASTQTSGGKIIDVVGENLPQNVTFVQAHLEYYVDKEKTGERGFSPHVSKGAADSVFGQFSTRVSAFCQQQRFYSLKDLFKTKSDSEVQVEYTPRPK